MKLVVCSRCSDIFNLKAYTKSCSCGKASGRYIDGLNAVISGTAIPIGFENSSFIDAIRNRPTCGLGSRFEAFIIPESCPTITEE